MDFIFKELDSNYIEEVINLQDKTFEWIEDKAILRNNSRETFLRCFNSPNITLGAFYEDDLAGIAILEFPENREEDLSLLLEGIDISNLNVANNKLVIVDKNYLGNGLQIMFGEKLMERARAMGVNLLLSTVSPNNPHSLNNTLKLGSKINKLIERYGYKRYLLYRFI